MRAAILRALPAMSPTVGLIWASATFSRSWPIGMSPLSRVLAPAADREIQVAAGAAPRPGRSPEDARGDPAQRLRAVVVRGVAVGEHGHREAPAATLEQRGLVHERTAPRLPPPALEERLPATCERVAGEAPALVGDDRREQMPRVA